MNLNRTKMRLALPMAAAVTMLFATTAEAGGPMRPGQIYKTAGKGVVLVFATDGSAQGSAGTGSIITEDGQIITNAHVVAKEGKPYKRLFVYLKPDKLKGSMRDDLKKRYEAKLVDIDTKLDLALLKMKSPPAGLTVIPFADPDATEIGDDVVAIGHPETAGLWTLTTGVISSVVADFQGIKGKNVFQTEASINRGNSGGPLLNAWGQMVGINTCISRRAKDGLAITDINFSLKSSVPVEWMKRNDLMSLAYVKPGQTTGSAATAVAVAEPAVPKKSAEGAKKYTIKTDDGSKVVAVVEPKKNEEVADDPEWEPDKTGGETTSVSGNRRMTRAQKRARARRLARKKKQKPRILTRRRPYKMEPFVAARVREIKALERMMDDMSRDIQRRSGKKTKKTRGKGLGLW